MPTDSWSILPHDTDSLDRGARGLGYSMSEALCEVGLKAIAILDVLQDHGDSAVAELNRKYNVAALFYKVDVRDAEAVSDVMNSVWLLLKPSRCSYV